MSPRKIPQDVLGETTLFWIFTTRKLLFALGGGVLIYLLVFGSVFPRYVGIPLAVVPTLLTLCFLFWEPYGRPFEIVLINWVLFHLRPRYKVWSRQEQKEVESVVFPYKIHYQWYGLKEAS